MNDQKHLLIVGGGFAGVWAAAGAARRRRNLRLDDEIAITLLSPDDHLGIRPRFYEPDLDTMRVALGRILDPIGVAHRRGRAVAVDPGARIVRTDDPDDAGDSGIRYDALIWATGSALVRPDLPGAEHLHTVDTFADAQVLDAHLRSLAGRTTDAARTVVVIGAGFTGLEVAAELHDRLRGALGPGPATRVVLVERAPTIAPEFGPDARAVIERAFGELGVEVRTSRSVSAVDPGGVRLDDGERIEAATVVWTGGVRTIPETGTIAPAADGLGRLAVDGHLAVEGVDGVWAAGDSARVVVDGTNVALMSCQHALPQGRYAGHNAVSALAGAKPRRYEQHAYTTCLDLGPWGALLTHGFDRNHVLAVEHDAKAVKRYINRTAIYPPLDDAAEILKAAKLPNGGKVAAAAFARLLASPKARAIGMRNATDRAAATGPVVGVA